MNEVTGKPRRVVGEAVAIIIIIITSSDDIQPSTLISDQSPSGLLLDIKVSGI